MAIGDIITANQSGAGGQSAYRAPIPAYQAYNPSTVETALVGRIDNENLGLAFPFIQAAQMDSRDNLRQYQQDLARAQVLQRALAEQHARGQDLESRRRLAASYQAHGIPALALADVAGITPHLSQPQAEAVAQGDVANLSNINAEATNRLLTGIAAGARDAGVFPAVASFPNFNPGTILGLPARMGTPTSVQAASAGGGGRGPQFTATQTPGGVVQGQVSRLPLDDPAAAQRAVEFLQRTIGGANHSAVTPGSQLGNQGSPLPRTFTPAAPTGATGATAPRAAPTLSQAQAAAIARQGITVQSITPRPDGSLAVRGVDSRGTVRNLNVLPATQ